MIRAYPVILAAGAAVWLAAAPAGAAPLARAPLRLEEPACELPPDASHAVGHALVQYRVTEKGLVEQVRAAYAVVRPESARTSFVGALEACVAGWRYQPARSGGRPVAESLLAAFHVFGDPPPDAPRIAIPGGRTMAVEQLLQLRREKQALAMFLLGGPDFLEIAADGYSLRSDMPAADTRTLASAIERAALAFEAAFPGAPQPPPGDRVLVHVFRSQEEFNQVVAFDELSPTHVPLAGQYAPEGGIIYLSAGGKPPRLTARVVAHEATHHMVHGRLYGRASAARSRKSPPFWVSEGVAAFIENLPFITAPAPPGPVDLAGLERGIQAEQGYTWRSDPDRYLMEMRRTAETGGLASVAELLAGRGPAGAERTLLYGQSWLLVHFLMNGDGGGHRDAFRQWLAGPEAAGDGQALLESLRMSPAALSARLDLHRQELETPSTPPPGRTLRQGSLSSRR